MHLKNYVCLSLTSDPNVYATELQLFTFQFDRFEWLSQLYSE